MKNGHNSEETYFVPLIPWHSNEAVKIHNIIDAEDECQCQLKLCKGSAGGGVINFYKHVSSNNSMFMSEISGESIDSMQLILQKFSKIFDEFIRQARYTLVEKGIFGLSKIRPIFD
ncbi:hypothetical protein RhiirA4_454421 [Rhizophagus irregularis]|uniref:Uncharacterized protein n=1 Tax=Rhizophagus irregularis TaxID=588596 RepID=A0A2I1G2V7_9GLOM|nr:hypothetical protein RhiirA4_454421 [Rhizophagus irregularis]